MANNEGTPLHGDRGAWNDVDFPTEHARDISISALTRHLPAPLAAGNIPVDQGATWQSKTMSGGATMDQNGVVTISPGAGSHVIEDEGSPLAPRLYLNFVGSGVVATDDAGHNATLVTIAGWPNPMTAAGDMIVEVAQNGSLGYGTNQATVALGASATASDTYAGSPGNVIDLNDATLWESNGPLINRWIYIDFGSAKWIAAWRLKQDPSSYNAPTTYAVQTSPDGAAWTTVQSRHWNDYAPNPDEVVLLTSPVFSRYIRFLATAVYYGTSGWLVYSIELYGAILTPAALHIGTPGQLLGLDVNGMPYWKSLNPATTVVAETTAGQGSSVGTSLNYAREDHTHGTPAGGGGGGGGGTGSAVYPQRGEFWWDEFTVLTGSALVLDNSTSEPYLSAWYQPSPANGDSLQVSFLAKAGTYNLNVMGETNTNQGKFDWYLDGVLCLSGQDWYNGSAQFGIVKTGTFTVAADGRHLLKAMVNGKNGSSSGYYIPLTKVWWNSSSETSELSSNSTGWVASGQTWTFESADAPTYNFSEPIDATAKYSVGMRVMCTNQAATQYGIITNVGTYSAGKTIITVYMGTDWSLTNTAITGAAYSMGKAPFGFPTRPDKWTVKVTDSTQRTQATPTNGTWYNLGTVSISIPIGAWNVDYQTLLSLNFAAANTCFSNVTLSTANNSESDVELSFGCYVNAVIQAMAPCNRSKQLILAAKTSYYLNSKAAATGAAALENRADLSRTILRAVCAYL